MLELSIAETFCLEQSNKVRLIAFQVCLLISESGPLQPNRLTSMVLLNTSDEGGLSILKCTWFTANDAETLPARSFGVQSESEFTPKIFILLIRLYFELRSIVNGISLTSLDSEIMEGT